MARNGMFRSALIGGFNKDDVYEYVQTLENEIEAVKALHQKEKNELLQKLEAEDEKCQESEETLSKLQEAISQKAVKEQEEREELQKKKEELLEWSRTLENMRAELDKRAGDYAREKSRAARLEMELQKQEEERKKQASKEAEEAAKPVQASEAAARLAAENERLKAELEKANRKLKEVHEQKEDELLDYKMIKKILNEANENAEQIRKEAHRESQKIVEAAVWEAEEKKKEIRHAVDSELEKRGIQLVAVKYRIMEYIKEVYHTQEGLYNLYNRMNHMVEGMPRSLADYWEEDEYQILVEQGSEEKGR